ncbi:hypothetical protein [Mucilaginibacter segetis]|uniref:Tetratricopeptide repeat protein n=1 Tax=Mucilaginibacter segetis TaxID=2793071 RepID=A0A934UMG3_9SPHI|nr:hypothetical protein [Mucilaginibacter segetis]MBK0378861.1 hypothetical protein [Mucilaginibacter segetis]
METYYTIEEKYLQAVEELAYGETPKALNMLNIIIADDATYARAHYQLGKIYYYDIKDYQTAGYHFNTCMQLEPLFPDNYIHYLGLLVFLKMESLVNKVAAKALETPGVNTASIHDMLGLYAEKNKQWPKALQAYNQAYLEVTGKTQREEIEESIARVKQKMQHVIAYQYTLTG